MQRRIRILSYNIHKGFNAGNRVFVLNRIREAIREVRADLVFLQEVLGHSGPHGPPELEVSGPQFEYLADRIWPHFAYGRNAVYSHGHHGNAILSRYPFSFAENIDVSTNRLERRGLLHGVIEIPHRRKPLHAICVHFGLLESERRSQVSRLCERIDRHVPHDEPLVIGGDFNDWRLRAGRRLEKRLDVVEVFSQLRGSPARTFPSWLPALKLDRIYFRGLRARHALCLTGEPWNQLSDHVALEAELSLG